MMLGRAALALSLLATMATAAGAQDDPLRTRLDPATFAAVTATIDSARRVGLPVEPLVNKALEGASKGAPGPRITLAVASLARQLGAARDALGGTASPAELTAGAGAIQAGARQPDLMRLRETRPETSLLVPLGVLADLVARGVPAESASVAVLALATRGASDADFVTLRLDVERDISAGVPPAAAVGVRAQGGGAAAGGAGTAGGGTGRGASPGGTGVGPGQATPPRGKGADPPGKGAAPPGKAAEPPGKRPPPGKGQSGKHP